MREGLHKIVSSEDTIVAISTPAGRSALGVVRLSGNRAREIVSRCLHSRHPLTHRSANLGQWMQADGRLLDEVVVTLFESPHSYTGEDVIEISAHGNPMVLRLIVDGAHEGGARLAAPGEFTMRAVANGKMDLIQAEAVREFIEAQTEQQARTALRQLDGSLSRRIQPTKDQLVDAIAHLEAGIDFAEDDVDVPSSGPMIDKLRALEANLRELQSTFGYGRLLVQGIGLVIIGKPNAGKSSLFNRLVSAERAIVTEIAGTTRDVLTETVHLDGIPLRFADTAGVRDTEEPVESIGVRRTFEALAAADLVLVVLDGSRERDLNDRLVLEKVSGIPHLTVVNKADLPQLLDIGSGFGVDPIRVSARTGEGFEALRRRIQAFLLAGAADLSNDSVLTSVRQNDAVAQSIDRLQAASAALETKVPHEMVLLDLYAALAALNELTGEVVTEDILGRIFSTFCIGK